MKAGLVAAALAVLGAADATAQDIPAGTYMMPDSGYSITVQPQGDGLLVNEAGKDRTYTRSGPGTYDYTSPITGATYQLHYRDRGSVTATKIGSDAPPTLLVRRGGAVPEEPVAQATAPAPVVTAEPAPASPYLAVAERYQALTLTDKKDVQTWAFCSAAALKRSMATKDVADAYGREAAERLASISVDPARNPCPDAIPVELWPGSETAAAEALKAANAAQAAAAAQQAREIEAMRAKQAADQRAFEAAQAEHRAALEKSRQEQDAFARQQAAYQAALAEHQRLVEASRSGRKPQ